MLLRKILSSLLLIPFMLFSLCACNHKITIQDLNVERIIIRFNKSNINESDWELGFIGIFNEYNLKLPSSKIELTINYPEKLIDSLKGVNIKSSCEIPSKIDQYSQLEFTESSWTLSDIDIEKIENDMKDIDKIKLELYIDDKLVDAQNVELKLEITY